MLTLTTQSLSPAPLFPELLEDITPDRERSHSLRILQDRDLEENGPSPA